MEKPIDYYERLAQEFKKSKEALDMLTKRQNDMKAELIEAIKDQGFEDDKGHKWLKVGSLEEGAADNWAHETGRWDDLKRVVELLDEGKLLALAWENDDVAETIQAFYIEKETWAFKA